MRKEDDKWTIFLLNEITNDCALEYCLIRSYMGDYTDVAESFPNSPDANNLSAAANALVSSLIDGTFSESEQLSPLK
jgi:hypothetical protein